MKEIQKQLKKKKKINTGKIKNNVDITMYRGKEEIYKFYYHCIVPCTSIYNNCYV